MTSLPTYFQEISYGPMLVPSRSNHSIVNFSTSSETLSYLAASGPSSTSSAYGPSEIQQPSTVASSNLLTVEAAGHLVGHKLDVSCKYCFDIGSYVIGFSCRSYDATSVEYTVVIIIRFRFSGKRSGNESKLAIVGFSTAG